MLANLPNSKASTPSPIVYLIRHGEKPLNGGDGLTSQGEKRAEALVDIFGKHSKYSLGLIIAEHPKNSNSIRPTSSNQDTDDGRW